MDAKITLVPLGNNQWNVANGNPHLPKDSGAHVLTFNIVGNNTGKDITFANDPMWVQMGSKPGTKPASGSDMGQIGAWKVLNDGHQLVIVDWNDVSGQLYYRLNFNNYGPVDPIIDNGGGIKPPSPKFTLADYVGYAAVALVAFLVGMFAYRMFFAPKAAPSVAPAGDRDIG
jgi:hypothetical protein